jgi:eukaryotic-like serine/threonine-protein kinase
MQEVHTTLQLGTIIRGRYVVEDVLRERSFGAVYLVRDVRSKRNLFVLKEVARPGSKERHQIAFGSRLFKRLDHPALPRIYQIFKDGRRGPVYMLMDYIEGPNLEILRQGQPEQRFSLHHAITLIAPIMDAVTHLHSQHHPIIHGNIKPSNIIARKENDAPVLVGFSLVEEYDTGSIPTAAHGYRAPEKYSGEIDPRIDIYALGAVLYTLLSGTIPADALNRLTQLDMKEPDPLLPVNQITPGVPTTTAGAIHRAMSIHKNDRFSTVEHFWEALWQASIFNPIVQPTWLPVERLRVEESKELDANPPLHLIPEPVVAAPVEKAPVLHTNSPWQQAPEPVIASSDPPHRPVLSEEVKKPATASLQKQPQSHQFKKPKKTFLILFILLITLLISIGLGTGLWFYSTDHPGPLPTLAHQFKATPPATANPDSQITATPSLEATIYPKVAASYNGTIFDLASNVSTKMFITTIQQQQGNIRGYITGLRWNGPFQGSIDTAKHIQFSFTGNVGQATLTFAGNMQSDGNIEGSYCSSPNQAGQCSDYGIWSVAPATSG